MNERMDPAARSTTAEEQRIHAVLTALGSVRPDEEFEQRLARRLVDVPTRHQKPSWKWEKLRLPLVLAGGCAALLVTLAMLQPRSRGNGLIGLQRSAEAGHSVAAVAAHRPWMQAAKPAAKVADAALKSRLQRVTAAVKPQAQRTQTQASLREASFPAPPMPLTEQEQLLLRVAHRNDPEEIAMLNPVERGLQAAQERAESAKFFAPAPLPPDIQQQINAALRSQYVNTPPPQELIAQSTNRSTP